MATRSRIAIENENGTVTSIYCHFDGYLEGVGDTLVVHYTDPEKVKELIALGSISYLESKLTPEPGTQHSFETPANGVTVAYHRDRGEEFMQDQHEDAADFFASDVEEYGYLFRDGEWLFVNGHESPSRRRPQSVGAVLSGLV